MKGYRTIVFNLIMGVGAAIGLQIAPDAAQHWATIVIVVWMGGALLLRFLTTTPAFKTLPPDVQRVASEIAGSVPTGKVLYSAVSAVDSALSAAAPATGGATITGPPADLVGLATSITNALATVQAVHAQVAAALSAGKDAVGAALPAVTADAASDDAAKSVDAVDVDPAAVPAPGGAPPSADAAVAQAAPGVPSPNTTVVQ
jgi:putative Mn2+ efflux pump MntP